MAEKCRSMILMNFDGSICAIFCPEIEKETSNVMFVDFEVTSA